MKMQVHEDLTGGGSETFTWVIFKGFGAFEKLRGQGSGSTVSSGLGHGPVDQHVRGVRARLNRW